MLYGLIGSPVKHSLSAVMHTAAFEAIGIDADYRLFDIPESELKSFFIDQDRIIEDITGRPFKISSLDGFNITIPHKISSKIIIQENFPLRSSFDSLSDLVGAINTVKKEDDRFLCTNTDALGFLDSLKNDLSFSETGINAFVFGCGGAGRAVISGLISGEATIADCVYVYDINSVAKHELLQHFSKFPNIRDKICFVEEEDIALYLSKSSLLINATSVGMRQGDSLSLVDRQLLCHGLTVYDLVYNRQTQLIKDAHSKGLAASDGLGMLLYQGVRAWEFWTQKAAPVDVMKKALLKAIAG